MHYQGPVTIVGSISGRKRQYEMEHNGKRYKGDISMLIPEQTMLEIDVTTLDVTDSRESGTKPKPHVNGDEIREEDLIRCKTELTDTKRYLAEIDKIYLTKQKLSISQLQLNQLKTISTNQSIRDVKISEVHVSEKRG
jgi:hypothetical protein